MLSESNVFGPSSANDNRPADSNGISQLTATANAMCNAADFAQMTAKIESLKRWTVSTYKTTKHSICENLGKVDRTVDKALDDQIESLKDLHRRYNQVLSMAKIFNASFRQMNEAKKGLAESLYQLSLKEPDLKGDLTSNSEALRLLAHNGNLLEKALDYFQSSLRTLCDKTIEDTLQTIHSHDQARLEYDIHRNEELLVRQQPNASVESVESAQQKCYFYRSRYEKLKEDVKVKISLLQENRNKVMHKQLLLLHSALLAYFSGNVKNLQSAVDQFNFNNSEKMAITAPSFLEQ